MRLFRPAFPIAALAALAACAGAGPNVLDSAFPVARLGQQGRLAGVDTAGFTIQRVLGQPDGLEPLREDQSLNLREADGRTLRDLLDVEGTRPSIFEQMGRGGRAPDEFTPPPPRRRGSSTPPQASTLPEVEPRAVTAPRPPPLAAAPRPLSPGTAIPGPGGPTVVGGSAGAVATTVGPAGQPGSAVRDGGTVTLFGADGSIRTVPVPQR